VRKMPHAAAVTSAVPAPSEPFECDGRSDPSLSVASFLLPQSAGDTAGAADARTAMVARLEENGELRPGPVREALLALPREILMPEAYVRRSAPDEDPPRWDLLDWARPADREELLERLHSGDSVAIQHDGEPILGRTIGPRHGGAMTAMSSTMGMTADLLQLLDLRPGQRVLDIGTGAGVTAAVACFACGDVGVVTLDIDPHVTAAARERLSALGYQPAAVTGDGTAGAARGRVRTPRQHRLRPAVPVRLLPRHHHHGRRAKTAHQDRSASGHGARRVAGPRRPVPRAGAPLRRRGPCDRHARVRVVDARASRRPPQVGRDDLRPPGHLGGDPGRRRPLAGGR